MGEIHMKKYVLILLLQFTLFFAFAQENPIIYGIVTDSINDDPLNGAIIVIDEKSGTMSDIRGFYSIVATGDKIILTCRFLGYVTSTLGIDVRGKDTIHVDFRMKQSFTPLGEIVVSAGKYEQKLSDVMVSLEG